MSKFYENESRFHELNNLASKCAILEFDEKRGLQSESIAELLCNFREVIENAMNVDTLDNVYDDSDVQVIPLHIGDDPAFLCYLGTKSLTEKEAQEVYEFLMEDPIEEYDVQ
jgi:hypothetical protein